MSNILASPFWAATHSDKVGWDGSVSPPTWKGVPVLIQREWNEDERCEDVLHVTDSEADVGAPPTTERLQWLEASYRRVAEGTELSKRDREFCRTFADDLHWAQHGAPRKDKP